MNYSERPEVNQDPLFSMVENIVLDWLNKYPLESSQNQLSITDPTDKTQVKLWVTGVWGRISHQLRDSGLPVDNKKIMAMAREIFNREASRHRWFEQIKNSLPTAPPSMGWLE